MRSDRRRTTGLELDFEEGLREPVLELFSGLSAVLEFGKIGELSKLLKIDAIVGNIWPLDPKLLLLSMTITFCWEGFLAKSEPAKSRDPIEGLRAD